MHLALVGQELSIQQEQIDLKDQFYRYQVNQLLYHRLTQITVTLVYSDFI